MIQKLQGLQKQYDYTNRVNTAIEFNKILDAITVQDKLKVSGHAEARLRERNINLTERDMEQLNTAIKTLKEKGSRESLILYRDIAFIASVKNNTIITAMDDRSLKENVITNIDSAIII